MTVCIITILITLLGITDRFHIILSTKLEQARILHILPPPALIQWLFIVCLFAFFGVQLHTLVHWVFLSAFAGLTIYSLFSRWGLKDGHEYLLPAEQLMTLRLFVFSFMVNIALHGIQ
jgi:hypothetical protein